MAETKVTQDWRCPKMREHMAFSGRKKVGLPVPCKDCYSVEIVETPKQLDLRTIDNHRYWIQWDLDLRTK